MVSATPRFRAWLVVATLFATVGCDQATKHLARVELADAPRLMLRGHVQLILAENRGSFLSLGDGMHEDARFAIFTLGVAVVLLVASVILLRRPPQTRVELIAAALVIGGGWGNLLDRAFRHGAVTDFLFLHAGRLRTGIFNVADIAITLGAILLLTARAATRTRPAA